MSVAIVQTKSQINGNAIPGAFTITSAPTVGNLVVASVGVNIAKASLTINTTDWHILKIVRDKTDTTTFQFIVARYAQMGDTSTLPAFATAGSTYSSYLVWEVSGVSGVLADDVLGIWADSASNGYTAFVLNEMLCPVNGALALVAGTRYNGSSDQSISGGWTQDEAQHNASNYGSVFGAHQTFNDADSISGTVTIPSTSNPGSYTMILLSTGVRPTRPFVRQTTKRTSGGASFPGSLNLGMDPLSGSLVVALLSWQDGSQASPTINTTDWPNTLTHADATGIQVAAYARYASGDSGLAMPALATAGTAFYYVYMIEIIGVTGTLGTDVVFADSARQASGASMTTTSRSTGGANQLGIVYASNYDANVELALSGSFNTLSRAVDLSEYGVVRLGQKEYVSGGSTVQSTITEANSSFPAGWVQIIIANGAGGGGPATYNVSVSESLSLTDVVSEGSSDVRSVSESVTLAETVSASIGRAAPNVTVIVVS